MLRGHSLFGIALVGWLTGCFDPRYGQGALCSERQTCPPGQTCDGQVCRLTVPDPGADAAIVDASADDAADASAIDAAADASVDATADASVDATADASVDGAADATVDASVDAAPPPPCNARGGVALASSTFSGYSPGRINDGDLDTRVGGAYSWTNEEGQLPAWVQLTLPAPCSVSRVVLYTSDEYLGDLYRISSYEVQLRDDAQGPWRTVADVSGNTDVMRIHALPQTTITDVRILGHAGPSHQPQYVRVNELELY